jgi:DNA-binding winged helix-turn-helix (wHTH) protein
MIYTFTDCELDTQRLTFRRAGHLRHLRPRAFAVLRYLVMHRDRVVDKQELYEQIWPEQFISDATIESTLRAVRQAVGDSGKAQRLIQTFHRRGYRFVADVDERDEEQPAVRLRAGLEKPLAESRHTSSEEAAVPPPSTMGYDGLGATLDRSNAGTPSATARTPAILAATATAAVGGSDAEHRHLTVLWCALVEPVALTTHLDAEDLHEVIQAYHIASAAVVARFEGYVAQYRDDGLLAYFGFPQAHEDDA